MKYISGYKNDEIVIFADASLYSRTSIFKCLYWYGDKFYTDIQLKDEDTYGITLKVIDSMVVKEDEMPHYYQKLVRDLLDFQLREIVEKETHNIRELLIAKAFSNGELEELPPGEISDPVGFAINP